MSHGDDNDTIAYSDHPIDDPKDDAFGIVPLAQTVARCIRGMGKPEGDAIAVCGPWGTGKSSTMKLVVRELEQEDKDIHIVHFHCWHYRTENAIAHGFFRDLYAGLGPALSKSSKAKRAFKHLSARMAGAGTVVGSVFGVATHPTVGAILQFIWDKLLDRKEAEQGDQKLMKDLAEELREYPGRFLIVIDDMDRLLGQEVVTIFSLIKTIGRLPRVIYLLGYDRKIVQGTMGTQGVETSESYLEKIVQVSFELPKTGEEQLKDMLRYHLVCIFGEVRHLDEEVPYQALVDMIVPEVRTPREAVRLLDLIRVAWGGVKGDVCPSDFTIVCNLHRARPELYRKIQECQLQLVGSSTNPFLDIPDLDGEAYERLLLDDIEGSDYDYVKMLLMRLFPQLEAVWDNVTYSTEDREEWDTTRRICSPHHFDSYFVYSVSRSTVSMTELEEIGARAADVEFVKSKLVEALGVMLAGGRSKASYLLEGITQHSNLIKAGDVEAFLSAVFEVCGPLLVRAQESKDIAVKFDAGVLPWMVQALVLNRMNLNERSMCLLSAMRNASLPWLVSFEAIVRANVEVKEGQDPVPVEKTLMDKRSVKELTNLGIKRIRAAAADDSLIDKGAVFGVLFWWVQSEPSDTELVKAWCLRQSTKQDTAWKFVRELSLHLTRYTEPNLELVMNVGRVRNQLEQLRINGPFDDQDKRILDDVLKQM